MSNHLDDDIIDILNRHLVRVVPEADGGWWHELRYDGDYIEATYPRVDLSALLDACDASADKNHGALVEREIISSYRERSGA